MTEQVPLYRLVRSEPMQDYTPEKGAHKVYRVRYELPDGTMDYVDIPADQYNAKNVRLLVQKHASIHAEVYSMEGPPVEIPTNRGIG